MLAGFVGKRFSRNILYSFLIRLRWVQNSRYSISSSSNSSNFQLCVRDYDRISNFLKSGSSQSSDIRGNVLALFPLVTVKHSNVNEFVETNLTNWWRLFENISNKGEVDVQVYCQIVNGLRQINQTTNGKVLQKIGWKPFEILAERGMVNVNSLTCRQIDTILASLCIVQKTELCDEKVSDEFKIFLSNTLTEFFEAAQNGRIRYAEELKASVDFILQNCVELGLEKLPDNCLQSMLEIYSENFRIWRKWPLTVSETNKILIRLGNFHRIATTFLKWNVDADEYLKNFWSIMFYEMSYCFDNLVDKRRNRFRAQVLVLILRCAVEFNKREEFLKNKTILWKHMKLNFECLENSELENIYNIIRQNSNGVTEVESLLSKDIIKLIFIPRNIAMDG